MSLDFLRMDIKNVNNYFERMSVDVFPERVIFQFVISETLDKFSGDYTSSVDLRDYVSKNLPVKSGPQDEAEDEVFRSLHLVRNLGGLEERDFDRFTLGKFDLLKSLIAHDNERVASTFTASEQFELSSSSDEEDDDSESDEGEEEDDGSEDEWYEKHTELKGKKHEDKEDKKQRKTDAKEAKREKRKTKLKKHIKKKLVNKSKSKK